MSFAKIFESETLGQILVMKDTNDDGDPCVTVMFDHQLCGTEDTEIFLGLIKTHFGFDDDEKRDSVFDRVDIGKAESVVRSTLRDAGLMP